MTMTKLPIGEKVKDPTGNMAARMKAWKQPELVIILFNCWV